jgi:hypothetical protein
MIDISIRNSQTPNELTKRHNSSNNSFDLLVQRVWIITSCNDIYTPTDINKLTDARLLSNTDSTKMLNNKQSVIAIVVIKLQTIGEYSLRSNPTNTATEISIARKNVGIRKPSVIHISISRIESVFAENAKQKLVNKNTILDLIILWSSGKYTGEIIIDCIISGTPKKIIGIEHINTIRTRDIYCCKIVKIALAKFIVNKSIIATNPRTVWLSEFHARKSLGKFITSSNIEIDSIVVIGILIITLVKSNDKLIFINPKIKLLTIIIVKVIM